MRSRLIQKVVCVLIKKALARLVNIRLAEFFFVDGRSSLFSTCVNDEEKRFVALSPGKPFGFYLLMISPLKTRRLVLGEKKLFKNSSCIC